jgi:fatty acid desaturase
MPATLQSATTRKDHRSVNETELNSPELLKRVNALRATDNFTNWLYLARELTWIAACFLLPIWFYVSREAWGLSVWWNIPVTLLAITIMGGLQHRLTTLAHEASHYMLFKNRLLNEFVSDWFCMFPMLSTTHQYRLQHLAHHQFPNDPDKDPDQSQLRASGHRFTFPMPRWKFVWECVVKQILWVPNLIRYIRIRAKYNSTGGGSGPYLAKVPRSKILLILGVVYLLALAATLTYCVHLGDSTLLAVVPPAMLAPMLALYAVAPERYYIKALVKSDIPPRWMSCLRITHTTMVFTALAWASHLTGLPWGMYYIVLWLVPTVTSFSFCMILRQVVQHGNAPMDRLTNTRVFHVHPIIAWSVFPMGMDYHLPHHLFPMVPHYRLRKLHAILMEAESYRKNCVIVEGYFLPRKVPHDNPTVLDLMAKKID